MFDRVGSASGGADGGLTTPRDHCNEVATPPGQLAVGVGLAVAGVARARWPLTLTRLEQCCPAGSPTRLSGVRLGNGTTRVFLELAHRLAHDHQKRCD